jgi:RNA polymerase primary sigma factor
MSMRQLKISRSITSRESESIDKYLREINKVDLLTAEEEAQLFSRIRKGDQCALEVLTKANLRFVVSVAKQYQGHGLSLADLINEGNIGLISAAKRFDETKGFKFISYAVWWIRQNILKAITNDADIIRLPVNKKILGNRIQKANAVLEQVLERPATAEELSEYLSVNVTDVSSRMQMNNRAVSLDTPLNEEDDGSLIDVLENEDGINAFEKTSFDKSLHTELQRAMAGLNARQKETICCFFGLGMDFPLSLEEIANRFDLTVERVRQIKEKALLQLKSSESKKLLRSFLGS